ncbi:hypothetical protein BDD12DRAFT_883743 [Trichophaea hybrida]|nr:hypothetical protein BDD12DRAFT_883743 [Trichophaea hybrida]
MAPSAHDNLWDAWWGLTHPHIVKRNSPQLSTEIGSVATIGEYVNTHFGGLSVIEIDYNLLDDYVHYCTTGEYPSERDFDESSKDYLQDSYDF